MTYGNREVYADPPLALVAAELRFSYAPRLNRDEYRDRIIIGLDDRFPVVRPTQNVTLTIGPGGAQGQAEQRTMLTNNTRTESVTFGPNSLAFEATDYSGFPAFLATFRQVCQTVVDAGISPVVERIGLRYIDEIRVPGPVNGPADWSGWVHESLIDQVALGEDFSAQHAEGFVQYSLGGTRGLLFRFAAVSGPPIVQGVLKRRRDYQDGPYFALDADASETFEPGAFTLEVDKVAQTLEVLHDPVGHLFQRAITDKTRNLFRKGGQEK
jgi:uncharacterized protein (TIGR04255 family)